jgi:3,4-dihydroxy 2-butanone 4-phosphate synthase/GTP cyclohydrolase II
VRRVNETVLPTDFADFRMICFGNDIYAGETAVALVLGQLSGSDPALVYVHSQCLHGDVFGSALCDCRNLLEQSMRTIASAGRGALVYLQRPQDVAHMQTVAAMESNLEQKTEDDLIRRALATQVVSDLGIRKVRLLRDKHTQLPILQAFGVEIVEHVPLTLTNTLKVRIGAFQGVHGLRPT